LVLGGTDTEQAKNRIREAVETDSEEGRQRLERARRR
jgi:hypothetical protein